MLVFALVCLVIWLPFGLRLMGVLEEWDVLTQFTKHGLFFFVGSDTPLAAHRLRPLTIFPHAVAYWLDPNSFNLWHVALILALFVKGIGSWLLVRAVTNSSRWGVVFGLLVVLYPADTMQLAFRGQHINWSVALLLLGSALVCVAQNRPRTSHRRLLGGLAALSLITAILLYEVAFPLVAMPFMIMFAWHGASASLRSIKARPGPSFMWLTSALVYVTYVLLLPPMKEISYQATLTAGQSPLQRLVSALPKLWDPGVIRATVGGWIDAWGMFLSIGVGYAVIAALVLFAGALATHDRTHGQAVQPDVDQALPLRLLRLAAVGLVLIALGYTPYLFSPSHVAISQRTYLFAAPGGALFALACLMALTRLAKPVGWVGLLFLLILGVAAQLFQFKHYVSISEQQRQILKTVIENFDGNLNGRTLLIKDMSGQLGHTWMLRDHLRLALTYFYGKPIDQVEICLTQRLDWEHLDKLARPGKCVESEDNWTLRGPKPVSGPDMPEEPADKPIVLPKERIVVLELRPNGTITPDPRLEQHRRELLEGRSTLAIRYRNILVRDGTSLFSRLLNDSSNLEGYRWDFGTWWNLDIPIRGSGWREAEWEGHGFHSTASAWKVQEVSSLIFDLQPASRPYVLKGEFRLILNEAIRNSIRLKINGHTVDLKWTPPYVFEASVPSGFLSQGANTLELDSAVDTAYYGLSANLDWVELQPR